MPTTFLRPAALALCALALTACASDRETAEVTRTMTPEPERCTELSPVYATVLGAQGVRLRDATRLTREDAVLVGATTRLNAAGQQDANAIAYTLRTREGEQVRLVSQQQLGQGDMIYVEPDSCGNARLSIVTESG